MPQVTCELVVQFLPTEKASVLEQIQDFTILMMELMLKDPPKGDDMYANFVSPDVPKAIVKVYGPFAGAIAKRLLQTFYGAFRLCPTNNEPSYDLEFLKTSCLAAQQVGDGVVGGTLPSSRLSGGRCEPSLN